jgi:hypothetical protein
MLTTLTRTFDQYEGAAIVDSRVLEKWRREMLANYEQWISNRKVCFLFGEISVPYPTRKGGMMHKGEVKPVEDC